MAAETMETLKATCLCGACAFTAEVPKSSLPQAGYLCHCTSCRHATGALLNCTTAWPLSVPTTAPELTPYAVTPALTLHFCNVCGTTMFAHNGVKNFVRVATGTLERTAGVVAYSAHANVADTRDGGLSGWLLRIGDAKVARWPGFRDEGEELEERWPRDDVGRSAEVGVKGEETLRAHCHCGGVDFLVTRPNEASAKPPYLDPADPKLARGTWWLSPDHKRYLAGICACRPCRLACGSSGDVMPWAFVPLANMTEPGGAPYSFTSSATLRCYRSSERAQRYFCGGCGATAFYVANDRPTLLDVAVALLDAPEGARAEEWLAWHRAAVSYAAEAREEEIVKAWAEGMKAWRVKVEGLVKG